MARRDAGRMRAVSLTNHPECGSDCFAGAKGEVLAMEKELCFSVDRSRYPILSKQGCTDLEGRTFVTGIDETLSAMISDTAGVIAELDGSSTTYTGVDAPAPPNKVIFLDKSARPVAWLVGMFWDVFAAPGSTRPSFSYLSIDRRPWIEMSGADLLDIDYVKASDGSLHRLGFGDFLQDNIGDDHFSWIRAQFIPGGIEHEDVAEVMAASCPLDGSSICVVDEVASTGTTLRIACWLLERAFRGASVRGMHFWHKLAGSRVAPDGALQMLSAPVWYDGTNPYGRGCGERDAEGIYYRERYLANPNPRTRAQAYGARVLSRIIDLGPSGPDANGTDRPSRGLALEMRQAKEDFLAGRILFQPPANYDRQRKKAAIEGQDVKITREPLPNSYVALCDRLKADRKYL